MITQLPPGLSDARLDVFLRLVGIVLPTGASAREVLLLLLVLLPMRLANSFNSDAVYVFRSGVNRVSTSTRT